MKPLIEVLLICTGGALGSISRYGIGLLSVRFFKGAFPLGTLIANLTGCFLIGLLIGSGRNHSYHELRLIFGVGFLGALTTFSTFGAETIEQANAGNWALFVSNIAFNLILGLLAVVIGIWLGKRWFV